MVYGSRTEFAVELFGAEAPQVMDGEGPQMQHVIAGKGIPLLYDHHLGSQERQVDGCTKATGSSPNYQTLQNNQHTVTGQSLEEIDVSAAASKHLTALRSALCLKHKLKFQVSLSISTCQVLPLIWLKQQP